MSQSEPQNQKQPKQLIKRFGREYTFQGVFEDADQLEKAKQNWKTAGHSVMIFPGKKLYVTTLKTRNY